MLGVCERMVQNVQTVRLSRNPSNSHSHASGQSVRNAFPSAAVAAIEAELQSVRNAFPSAAVAALEAELAASAFARAAAAASATRSHDEIRPGRPGRPGRPANLGILTIPGQRFWVSPLSRRLLLSPEDSFQFSPGSSDLSIQNYSDSHESDESF